MNKSFFENLAIEAGTGDIELVRKVYYGLIRKTVRDLGEGKNLFYPDFGKFFVVERKATRIKNVNTGVVSKVDPIVVARFKPGYRLREYIKIKSRS